ncbi:nucleoside diphosphate kinase Ndk1 [Coemansia sp. RSA 2523]|nr:nucleoside diphosphate kinase Ndk1 [Coemansia sp. RSA 1824]KAJ1809299.1 nucleoside diphosphate kinase Ndk1 [Coemansia sp. RSA 2523]KAJ2168753.1 nucleoside diphosphate kinase Ndk1 [Coemansia sp. RSA 562]KAJ2199741.1 nucleoside diphosphate kinase Ndk1 [Coemansia sp. RSA 522]KAJ2205708.1 nucleoside diphosphate kinase Ndk1 [Coemansia sp. RSA 521]KAJ2248200.1 nucleoside diphosphate kinase Ndk1 [Coemansia sp. RSA 454]KAJ2273626.1 nucleoside diphosphate kinase Ndk1 [Coemansia sp. RSA 371]KAJ2279
MFARTATSTLRQVTRRQCAALTTRGLSTSSSQGARSAAARFGTAAAAAAAVSFGYTMYKSKTESSVVHADSSVPIYGVAGTSKERTFIAVKPDGVQRGLVSDIIARFERRGYKLVGMKLLVPSAALAKEHYADLSSKPFFAGLVDYMTNGKAPVLGMVWEGPAVIKQGRVMLGATDPKAAGPGTIRGDYCLTIGRNICHGSDSAESAQKEISMWFGGRGEIIDWTSNNEEWVVSDN